MCTNQLTRPCRSDILTSVSPSLCFTQMSRLNWCIAKYLWSTNTRARWVIHARTHTLDSEKNTGEMHQIEWNDRSLSKPPQWNRHLTYRDTAALSRTARPHLENACTFVFVHILSRVIFGGREVQEAQRWKTHLCRVDWCRWHKRSCEGRLKKKKEEVTDVQRPRGGESGGEDTWRGAACCTFCRTLTSQDRSH